MAGDSTAIQRFGRLIYWGCSVIAALAALLFVVVAVNWLLGTGHSDNGPFGMIVWGGISVLAFIIARAARYRLAGK